MNIWQIQEWAKRQDDKEPEFILNNVFEGRFVDKGFGFVNIPAVGEGVISLIHWAKDVNADMLNFEPIERSNNGT